jgi:DNA processing protein
LSTTQVAAAPRPESHAVHWVALAMTPQLGPGRARKLAERFGGVTNAMHASLTALEGAGLHAASAQAIFNGHSLAAAEEELVRAAASGAQVVDFDDTQYPPLLKQIYDPPLALYVRGNAAILAHPGIAVVGTRLPTPYGLGMAERLSCDLAVRGLIIISGLARGVDAAAHRGAVNAKGKTVAVLGTGVDVIYPRQNSRLVEQILATGGAIISEFCMGTFAAPQNFPIRNRIISGMSLGVLVVEAGEQSGTRITARCALEQNRELFAVPGNVTNKNSWGPNTLIKQGAKLTATWDDVWEELPTQVRVALTPPGSESGPESNLAAAASLFSEPQLPEHELKIYRVLKADESTHIDELVEKFEGRLSSSEIFSALFELEMSGRIRQMPGKNYVKTF